MSINFSYDPLDEGFLPSDLEEPSIQDFLSNEESRENSPAIPNLYNNYGKDSQNLQANMTLENTTAPESNARDEMLLKQEDRVNSSLNEFNHISPSDIKKEETDEDNLTPKIYENQTPKKPTNKKQVWQKDELFSIICFSFLNFVSFAFFLIYLLNHLLNLKYLQPYFALFHFFLFALLLKLILYHF